MDVALADAPPISVRGLTKAFGDQRAVEDLTFSIGHGRVTGFLGPNGAGKTTTLRIVLGLARATSGEALVFGRPFAELDAPSASVGALLDASGFHPGRRLRQELAVHAAAAGVDDDRVAVVLDEVGLTAAAGKRVGDLSLGMRQRLGLAAALLGEPRLLVLDEPANGLDPAGIHWLRELLRSRAARGTAVLVSSHLLSELAQVADDVVVLDRGRLVAQSTMTDLVTNRAGRVLVRSPDLGRLRSLVAAAGGSVTDGDGGAVVTGISAEAIGDLAASSAIPLHELHTEMASLEEVFLALTDGGDIR